MMKDTANLLLTRHRLQEPTGVSGRTSPTQAHVDTCGVALGGVT
jgi:hypothetical protein